jgi:hypothetical protein
MYSMFDAMNVSLWEKARDEGQGTKGSFSGRLCLPRLFPLNADVTLYRTVDCGT